MTQMHPSRSRLSPSSPKTWTESRIRVFLGVNPSLLLVSFIVPFPETSSADMSWLPPAQGEGCRLGGFSGPPLALAPFWHTSQSHELVVVREQVCHGFSVGPSKALQSHPDSHGRGSAARVMQGRLQSTGAPRSLCRRELEPGGGRGSYHGDLRPPLSRGCGGGVPVVGGRGEGGFVTPLPHGGDAEVPTTASC